MSTSHSNQQTIDRLGGSERTVTAGQAGQLRSYWPWLLFKEAKQLAPLLIALAACGLVLHLLGTFGYGNKSEASAISGFTLMMIPFLFAIGAGPMLVSQEKEERTLWWIGSLPVNPRSIMFSKLIVCVFGLALAWIVSFGLAWLLAVLPWNEIDFLPWIGGTFALLSIGFALAWIFPSAISSLIALAVTCCVMTNLVNVISSTFFDGKAFHDAFTFGALGLFSLSFAAAAVLYGQRFFVAGAATAPFLRSRSRQRLDSARANSPISGEIGYVPSSDSSRRHAQHDRSSFWTQSPSSSLIWQISRQNTWLWSGLLLTVIMSGGLFLYYSLDKPSAADFGLSILLPLGLVLSWLGASVFGSDAYRQRINFLAQRGVAPGLIWWTRMILPVGSVCLGLITFILLLWLPAEHQLDIVEIARQLSIPVLIVGVLMVFGFTQWFSQWTRSTLISFCVAPAAAAMTIGYQSFVIEFLRAPWWILLPSIAVAMLATRIMLCPWMDGRFDWQYWTSHIGLLLVALAIPVTPFLYTWATYPDISATMKRSLVAEVENYLQSPRDREVDLISNRYKPPTDDDTTALKDFAVVYSARLDAMQRELAEIDGPIGIPGNKIAITMADLMSLRMDALEDSDVSDDQKEADRKRYRQVMLLLDDLVRHMRLRENIFTQDYADTIERWMVSELNRAGRQEFFTEQQYARIVTRLADQEARHQARRRAIVMAWDESKTTANHQFKNMVATDERSLLAPEWLVTQRDAARAAAGLLRHLESSVARPIDYPGQLDGMFFVTVSNPGMLWHRPWESKAKKLAESLRSTPATKVNDDE